MKQPAGIEQYINKQSDIGRQSSDRLARIFSFTKSVSGQDRARFCLELSVMLQARISLHRALQILEEQSQKEPMKRVVGKLQQEVSKGNSFSAALHSQPEVFDNLFVITAEIGQESGRLSQVMGNLAIYLEKINLLKKKFFQSLMYPLLVLAVALFAVLFLLLFIVPTFAEMFRSIQVELPVSTQIILSISDWLTAYGVYLVAGIVIFFLLFRSLLFSQQFKERMERILYRIPFAGQILLKNQVARFCRSLGTMLQAQVSLVNALEVLQKIFTNKDFQNEIQTILKQVKGGKTIAEPMIQSVMFPPMVAQMIAVGEETSELDTMLMKVAEYYEKEIDSTVESLSNIIEPVLILLLGFIVAAILISMYMPMFEMMNVIG